MDINNVIKINDIVTRYNTVKEQYNLVIEDVLRLKDELSECELRRSELFDTLSEIRCEEINFLNVLKNDSPEEYSELMEKIKRSAADNIAG